MAETQASANQQQIADELNDVAEPVEESDIANTRQPSTPGPSATENDLILPSSMGELTSKSQVPISFDEGSSISGDSEVSGNQFVDLEMTNLTAASRYGVIWINTDQRPFFPGYEIPFELETDIGVLTARVSSSATGTTTGDPTAGQFIQGGLQDWYKAHNDLRVGAKLRIEALELYKRYNLTVINPH